MEPNLGTRGATRQSWKPESIRQIVKEIQDDHPRAGRDRLIRLLAERISEDDRARDLASEYVIDNCLNVQASYERRDAARARPTPQEAAKRASETAERVENIKAQIALLNLPMANGKLARYCTGAELEHVGGAWVRVGKKIGKTGILGQKMNETEVHKYFA
jgi:hypothetical protein